jgi:hypothetical protein
MTEAMSDLEAAEEARVTKMHEATCRLMDMISNDFDLDDEQKFYVVGSLIWNTANRLQCPETENMGRKERSAYWLNKYRGEFTQRNPITVEEQ